MIQRKRNQVAKKIDITDKKAEYDENVKWLLSEKIILAHVLIHVAKEYQGLKPEEVVGLIEGMPKISEVAVNPSESNATEIVGENVESTVPNEGKITYDIRFRALTPDKMQKIQLIIDIEAQKEYYPGYDIITRGIYYGARLISAQKECEFTGDDYDKIKKVYSIWICMNAPKYAENTITEYAIQKRDIVGEFPKDKGRYDLMSVITVCLSKELAQVGSTTKLHRLLGTLLSSEMTRKEKKDIIESEYGISMTQDIERRVNTMCNLSEVIEERGINKGIEKGIEKGNAQRLVKSIEANMRNFEIDLETACKGNEITVEEYWTAKELVSKCP